MKSFTQKEIVEIIGINPNTLQVWLRDGLIIPSIANPKGRGQTRLYSVSDLTLIKIISILSQLSYNRATIKGLCDYLNGEMIKKQAKLLKPTKKMLKAGGFSSVKDLISLHKESKLDPFFHHFGTPLYIILSNEKWELRINLNSLPEDRTTLLIINVTKIMDEIKQKIG